MPFQKLGTLMGDVTEEPFLSKTAIVSTDRIRSLPLSHSTDQQLQLSQKSKQKGLDFQLMFWNSFHMNHYAHVILRDTNQIRAAKIIQCMKLSALMCDRNRHWFNRNLNHHRPSIGKRKCGSISGLLFLSF